MLSVTSSRAMNSSIDRAAMGTETDAVHALWLEVQKHLDQKRAEIYAEISNYPPPIPACDQQFNYLLEQRTQINQEWRQVNEVLEQNLPDDDASHALQEFLQTSTFMDETFKARVRAQLGS